MKVGDTLKTGSFRWVIVGLFDADGSAYESEIWTDVTDLQQQTKRNIYSTVFVRLPDADAAGRFIETIKGDQRLKLEGKTERKYFDEQMITGGSDQGARLHRRHLHGDRRRLRRDEHDVRAGVGAHPGDRDAAGDRLLAALDPASPS